MSGRPKGSGDNQLEQDILKFMKDYLIRNGYPATVRAIAKAMNLSPTGTHYYIVRLYNAGYVEKRGRIIVPKGMKVSFD